MLEPGRQVGNYRIEQLVGRGGQGFVYRAVHVQLGTMHAVKLLLLERGPLRERLLDEGRIQARLRHPNLVPVTDVIEVDGALALVAEFVAGVPLDAWVAAEKPTLDVRLEVFRGVCAAVGAAHGARVVHRDLKPGNVLVEVVDGRPIARVTDFGVAKLLDPVPGQSVTLPGLPVGTPGYMAPEQLRDASSVDARADIFALGCLLYELACGARPFPDTNLAVYAAALTTGVFIPPDACIVGLPPEVGVTVAACLRVDPAARPADIAEVLALLDGAPPREVPTPTHVAPMGPPSSPTYAAASLPPAPVSGSAALATPTTRVTFPPSLRPRRRTMRWIILAGVIVATAASTALAVTALGWVARDYVVAAPAALPEATLPGAVLPGEPDAGGPTASVSIASPPPALPPAAATPPVTAPSATAAATAAPTVAPAPSTPEPPAPRTGKVVSSGEGEIVSLEKDGQQYGPDAVPVGTYTVFASFPGVEALVKTGLVSIRAGQTTRFKCDAQQQRCVREESP
ncbi:MAG: protein kinase [Myxococcota bacterium]